MDASALDSPSEAVPVTKRVPTLEDFELVGTLTVPAGTSALGDPGWGKGLAVRNEQGVLKLMLGTWDPQNIVELSVPESLEGGLTDMKLLGSVPICGDLYGLFWDAKEQKL